MTLKFSVVIFKTLKTQWPQQPKWPQEPHFIKKVLILMVWSSLAPKWPILVHFCRMDHQKSFFFTEFSTLSVGGCHNLGQPTVEASQCYFFENWFIKLKYPSLLKPIATVIQQSYWSLYPSGPFTFTRYTMRHPLAQNAFMDKTIASLTKINNE